MPSVTTYDGIIEEIGVFGWWQALILIALSIPDIFLAFALLLPVFTGATPSFSCVSAKSSNESLPASNSVFPGNKTTEEITGGTICTACSQFNYDNSFTSIVSEWDLVCHSDYVSNLITTIQLAGLLFGAMLFGQLSDSFGRKKAYTVVCVLLVAAGTVSGFAPNWKTYAAMRFVVGISAGGYFCINCVYSLEFIGVEWRTLCGTIGFWALGEMVLALVAYYIRNWRYLTVFTSLAGGFSFLAIWFAPESPRWLAQHNRTDEAMAIFVTIAKKNKRTMPDLSAVDMKDEKTVREKNYTYLDLFRSCPILLKTAAVLLSWFSLFLAYYEMSYNLQNLSGNRYFNMFLAGLVDLGAMLLVIALNNKLGRRNLQASLLAVAIASNACMLALQVLEKHEQYAIGYKVSALLGKSAALAGTYVIQIFTAELYATCIRNVGCGAGSVSGRVGALCAPQIMYLGTRYKIMPFLLIITLCAITLPVTYTLPETNGRPLEDSICNEARHVGTDAQIECRHENDISGTYTCERFGDNNRHTSV